MHLFLVGILGVLFLLRPHYANGQATPAGSADDRVEHFIYKQAEQRDLELTVDYPPGWSASDSRAAIVFFFGGGWAYSAIDHFERQAKYFANRGMVAVRPDVRVKNLDGTTPAESVEDAKSVVRWVRAHADALGIDPRRIVASGGSSGGHLAACTAQCTGPENANEDLSISSRPDAMILFNPLLQFSGIAEVEENYPVANEDVARQISPALHVQAGAPPTLLLFGSEDQLMDWAGGYLDRSREFGNRVDLYIARGQRHAFFNDSPWYENTLVKSDDFLLSLGYLPELPIVEEP